MTHIKTNKTKLLTLILGLTACLAVILGMASVNPQTVKADTMTIDTLEVAFNKVGVGESLATAFDFEDETERRLKVPAGANYTATLTIIFKNGQATTLWKKTARRFRGVELKINLSSKKLPTASASILHRKKTINFPKTENCLKGI